MHVSNRGIINQGAYSEQSSEATDDVSIFDHQELLTVL